MVHIDLSVRYFSARSAEKQRTAKTESTALPTISTPTA
jgi:hypothetical protein